MKKIFIFLIFLTLTCGCSKKSVDYEYTSNKELESLMQENAFLIVDVRTKEEYDTGHLKDAINIPYNEIDENIDLAKDKLILVYCKSGTRSNIAYNNLLKMGYNVYDLGALESLDLPRE